MDALYPTNPVGHTSCIFAENAPEGLRRLDQWMGTRFESRPDGKLDKPPYRVRHGLPAVKMDKTNPEAWANFGEAEEALHAGLVDAIGFVFSDNDPFGCIDLDECFTEVGEVDGWARRYIEALPTYWEVSVSSGGLHAIVEGKKSGTKCRRGSVEIYDRARFLVVTGWHLEDTPTEIRPCQEELDRLYQRVFGEEDTQQGPDLPLSPGSNLEDNEIPKRILRSKHSVKFDRLWRGDISGYESPSDADLGLCGILAFWTGGDTTQIERLFAQSGLCRTKWTKRPDYRQRTIRKALEGKTDFYTPPGQGIQVHFGKRRRARVYARRDAVIRDA
jgi:putative DNA primase/helicase